MVGFGNKLGCGPVLAIHDGIESGLLLIAEICKTWRSELDAGAGPSKSECSSLRQSRVWVLGADEDTLAMFSIFRRSPVLLSHGVAVSTVDAHPV